MLLRRPRRRRMLSLAKMLPTKFGNPSRLLGLLVPRLSSRMVSFGVARHRSLARIRRRWRSPLARARVLMIHSFPIWRFPLLVRPRRPDTKHTTVIYNVYKSTESWCTPSFSGTEVAIDWDPGAESFEAEEIGIIPTENVWSKVVLVRVPMGPFVTVDDLGSAADVPDGCFGAHLVCHGGEEVIDDDWN